MKIHKIKLLIIPILMFGIVFITSLSTNAKEPEKIIIDNETKAYIEKSEFTDLMDKYNNSNYFLSQETYKKLPSEVQNKVDNMALMQSRVTASANGAISTAYGNGYTVYWAASIKGSDGTVLYCMNPGKPFPAGHTYSIKKDRDNQALWNGIRYAKTINANWAETSVAVWLIQNGKTSGSFAIPGGSINVKNALANAKIKAIVNYGKANKTVESVKINLKNATSTYNKTLKTNITSGLVINGFTGNYKLEGLPKGVTIKNNGGTSNQNVNSLKSGTKYDIWYDPALSISKDIKATPISATQSVGMYWTVNANVQDLAQYFGKDPLSAGNFKINSKRALGDLKGGKVAKDIPFYNEPIRTSFSTGSFEDIDDEKNPVLYASKDNKPVIYITDDEKDNIAVKQLQYPSEEEFKLNSLYNKPITYSYIDYEVLSKEEFILDDNGNKIEIQDENGVNPGEENYIPTYKMEIVVETDDKGIFKVKPILDENGDYKIIEAKLNRNYPSEKEMNNIYGIGKVEFALKDSSRKLMETLVTNPNGSISKTGLIPGTYYVVETKTLPNLTLSSKEYKCDIAPGGECSLNNNQEIYNDANFGEHVITKIDVNGKALEGIIFDVYALDNDGNIDFDNKIGEVSTDENGKAYFNYYSGSYGYVEALAGDEYIFNSNQQYHFEIQAGQSSSSEVVNKLKYDDFEITKVDATNKKELEGAYMCVWDKATNKKLIGEDGIELCWTSTKESHVVKLPMKQQDDGSIIVGEYYLTEEIAPSGYLKLENIIPLIVNGNGEVQKVNVVNEPIIIAVTGYDFWKSIFN